MSTDREPRPDELEELREEDVTLADRLDEREQAELEDDDDQAKVSGDV